MGERSFVVAYAYIKTEPIQVALFGLIFLGDRSPYRGGAILVATAGVIVISLNPAPAVSTKAHPHRAGVGLIVRAFGDRLSRRHLNLHLPNFVMAATFTLAIGLLIQSVLLTAYLYCADPGVFAIARAWRPSLFAGFMGAFDLQFWYLAFAIATAAASARSRWSRCCSRKVITRFFFGQPTSSREAAGIVLIIVGVLSCLIGRIRPAARSINSGPRAAPARDGTRFPRRAAPSPPRGDASP